MNVIRSLWTLGFGHSFGFPHSDFVIKNVVRIISIYPHNSKENFCY